MNMEISQLIIQKLVRPKTFDNFSTEKNALLTVQSKGSCCVHQVCTGPCSVVYAAEHKAGYPLVKVKII